MLVQVCKVLLRITFDLKNHIIGTYKFHDKLL